MKREMPVPLVPGSRGRAVLDAELPRLSREELEAILDLVGGQHNEIPNTQSPQQCKECPRGECRPNPSGAC